MSRPRRRPFVGEGLTDKQRQLLTEIDGKPDDFADWTDEEEAVWDGRELASELRRLHGLDLTEPLRNAKKAKDDGHIEAFTAGLISQRGAPDDDTLSIVIANLVALRRLMNPDAIGPDDILPSPEEVCLELQRISDALKEKRE